MAEVLRKHTGANVQLVDGARSEFTVLIETEVVTEKGTILPDTSEVLGAVRQALANHNGKPRT